MMESEEKEEKITWEDLLNDEKTKIFKEKFTAPEQDYGVQDVLDLDDKTVKEKAEEFGIKGVAVNRLIKRIKELNVQKSKPATNQGKSSSFWIFKSNIKIISKHFLKLEY